MTQKYIVQDANLSAYCSLMCNRTFIKDSGNHCFIDNRGEIHKFVTITSSGLKKEGEPAKFYADRDAAIKDFKQIFAKYAAGVNVSSWRRFLFWRALRRHLYVRISPQFIIHPDNNKCYVRMRCVIVLTR